MLFYDGDRFVLILPYDGYRMTSHLLIVIRYLAHNNVTLKYPLNILKSILDLLGLSDL